MGEQKCNIVVIEKVNLKIKVKILLDLLKY